jgi:pyruvate formate-lyase/glycerol dehydratase family glycyl radical enzyme
MSVALVKKEDVGSWQQVFVPTCSERIKKAKKRAIREMEFCLERARAHMRAVEEYKNDPMVIQRARIFERYLKDKSVNILEGELIVGNVTSKVRGGSFAPEMVNFVDKELDDPVRDFQVRPLDKFMVTSEQRKELREELIPFFKGRTLGDVILKRVDQEVKDKAFSETACDPHIPVIGDLSMTKDLGHQVVNYEKVLYKGLQGIRKEVEYYMAELEQPYIRYGKEEKRNFYKAALITLDAAMSYVKRYASLARKMATEENNPGRKKELERIAQNCEHVPIHPARDWWEACQSFWMIHLLTLCEVWNVGNMPGRFDQFMVPFYKKSVMEEKRLTRDEALEILECVWIKFNEWAYILSYDVATYQPGQALSQTVTLGGQKHDGSDACNEVTLLCLDAEEQVGLPQPDVAMKLWEKTPHEYVKRASEVIRLGRGKPKFISERKAVQMAAKSHPSLSPGDLHECCVQGCTELAMPHISMLHSWEGFCVMPKVLELVLSNGKCVLCDKQIGPATGDPRSFSSMAALQNAYKEQLHYWMKLMVKGIKVVKEAQSEMLHVPFCSALSEGPLQKGRDLVEGGAWFNNCGVFAAGLADTADSLTVIDKLIYRDKAVTWEQLLRAIKDNWEGHEHLRQLCLKGVPKYGNDDDYADGWAIWVMESWYDCLDWINNQRELAPKAFPEGSYLGAGMIGQSNVIFGPAIGALPNGRANPQPIAECNSPFPGVDRNGPSAVIRSMSKLPTQRFALGGLLNLRISAQQVATDSDIEKYAAFLRAIEELGIYHTQFNVVSSDLLRKAMKDPEKYRDLLVRVASYMAYYVELTKEMQLDIISRTEHQGW